MMRYRKGMRNVDSSNSNYKIQKIWSVHHTHISFLIRFFSGTFLNERVGKIMGGGCIDLTILFRSDGNRWTCRSLAPL